MSSTSIGRQAEEASADYLRERGYEILSMNWRNRNCEIDIVARSSKGLLIRNEKIHFVEVKFRKTQKHGSGTDYVTARKLQQMNFAASNWIYENDWDGDYQLDVMSVTLASDEWLFDFIENILID